MEKFNLEPGEAILKSGPLKKYEGDAAVLQSFKAGTIGFMDILRKLKQVYCKGFLTPKRFVICPRTKIGPPFGPAVWLFHWIFNRKKILFAVNLDAIAGIDDVRGKGVFTLRAKDGTEVLLSSDAFLSADSETREWARAIKNAMTGGQAPARES